MQGFCDAGEVPNLFPKDELAGVLDEVRAPAKKAGAGETGEALYAYFLERVRTNLHVILCLSPIGEAFRERCRMFPGLSTWHWHPSAFKAIHQLSKHNMSFLHYPAQTTLRKLFA